ncbi:MAG: hypothetical protein WCI90_10760 [Chlorobium sp.]|nr:MAG: hypothetical protein FDX17_08180 [Chlorobium sp.]
MIKHLEETYAVKVLGDSMIGLGVCVEISSCAGWGKFGDQMKYDVGYWADVCNLSGVEEANEEKRMKMRWL